jgi:hypothetical protein
MKGTSPSNKTSQRTNERDSGSLIPALQRTGRPLIQCYVAKASILRIDSVSAATVFATNGTDASTETRRRE